MYILGFNGGFDLAHERRMVMGEDATHDAAASLIKDGRLVAAIEEERLTRIKHCAKFPVNAIRFCLDTEAIGISEIDKFAFFSEEAFADYYLNLIYMNRPSVYGPRTYREFFVSRIATEFGVRLAPEKLQFVSHHLAHATAAHIASGMDDCLVVVLDGQGETQSGLIAHGTRDGITTLRRLTVDQSLGYMYLSVIRLLGYWNGDEYKVMGLAPYGDPDRFRRFFKLGYELLPDGEYRIDEAKMSAALLRFCPPRRRHERFEQTHCDIAAGLQATLERIVMHVLTHFRSVTSLPSLALAGGVAHNCSLNGRIARSGLFERIFVHPAAYDPGCSLGAALSVSRALAVPPERGSGTEIFLGSDAGEGLLACLATWSEFVRAERPTDIVGSVAEALAAGEIVGWVQGRSEFGPRALGARCILADPRPAANRDRVNRAVKKREVYRPFAPAVPAERVFDYFVEPASTADTRFMSFALDVRPEWRDGLAAVTHVDGTARVQTVERSAQPRFWALLDRFGALTGTHVLLSTSFNNNVEPIVESAWDAVECFLTTGIDRLVIGDHIIERLPFTSAALGGCVAAVPPHLTLNSRIGRGSERVQGTSYYIATTAKYAFEQPISANAFEVMARCDGDTSLHTLLDALVPSPSRTVVLEEIRELWSSRLVTLRPRRR